MMAEFAAGYGETQITPPLGTDLSGFGFYLDRRAEAVLDDLKIRALWIRDQTQNLLLISCDLLGLTVGFSDCLRERLASAYGLPVQNILLSCTHTHSGPAAQPMPGLGRVDAAYLRRLPKAVQCAAAKALASLEPAEFGYHFEAVEPIGFNRRLENFSAIDPWLKMAVFKQKKRKIYLLSYACHPVTLGPSKEISADWPGAAAAEIQKEGHCGIVFQGFCGDIDPVTYLNRRLGATKQDIALCGKILAERAAKAERYLTLEPRPALRALEARIRLPLLVFPKRDLDKETRAALEMTKAFVQAGKIIKAWRRRAEKCQAALRRSPWLGDVPVQALAIGRLKILGLPGEVFCGLGLKLRRKWPSLMTIGYANGNVGYLPTREAYKSPGDYACYSAPKFYAVFPFAPKTESLLFRESHKLLTTL